MNILENTVIVTYPNCEFKLEYRIDKEGNVYSPYKNWNKLSQQKIKKGYLRVNLRTIDGKDKRFMVHRLVLASFNPIENLENYEVNHKDGNKENNKLENLEWCNGSYNVRHSIRVGLKIPLKGEEIGNSKLSEKEVKEIWDLLKTTNKSLQEIGDLYGVSKYCISDIKRQKSWKWLTKTL